MKGMKGGKKTLSGVASSNGKGGQFADWAKGERVRYRSRKSLGRRGR